MANRGRQHSTMSTEGDQHQETCPVRESLEKPIEPTSSHAEGPTENINNALVAEAIEAIGFGKYQWQLTFTCGFGFLVDQVCGLRLSPLARPSGSASNVI